MHKRLELEWKKPVILAGDLNVAHLDLDIYDPLNRGTLPGFHPEEREMFQ